MRDTFRSDLRIGKINAPLIMVHDRRDPVIPYRLGQALFELAREPKAFVSTDFGGHQALEYPQAAARVSAWLDSRASARAPQIAPQVAPRK